MALMDRATVLLARTAHRVPVQDLRLDMRRLLALPKDHFRVQLDIVPAV